MPQIRSLALLLLNFSMGGAMTPLKGQFHLLNDVNQYEIVVRFDEAWNPSTQNGLIQFKKQIPINWQNTLKTLQNTYQIQFQTLFNKANFQTSLSGLTTLKSKAKNTDLLAICQILEQLPLVKYCNLIPNTLPPNISNPTPTPTPELWVNSQGYLNPSPQGIDALFAWSLGVTGQGIVVHDVEWAWTQEHQDLNPSQLSIGILEPDESYAPHGTAVLGEMIAAKNDFGMTGAAHGLEQMWLYSEQGGRIAAVAAAIQNAKAGDVLLLELQRPGCQSNGFGPADYDQALWDLIQEASTKGITVVYAAGNGQQDLDHPCYDAYRNRGDHGGILVGAGTPNTLNPTSFSSFGSPVHLQAWGESVYSLGYGDLFDGGSAESQYTQKFNGTSSAAPLVASAVILIQSWAKIHLGRTLSPLEIRTLLINTGTSQGPGNHIGPLPNIKAALEMLAQDYQIPLIPLSSNTSSSSSTSSSSAISSSSQISSSSSEAISSSTTPTSSSLLSSSNWSSSSDISPLKSIAKSEFKWNHTQFEWIGHTHFEWRIWNLQGQLLQSNFSVNSSVIWPQRLIQGLYFLQVQSANEQKMIQIVVP